jgi:hypothetical protein
VAEELRNDWHVIAPDLRGHGMSVRQQQMDEVTRKNTEAEKMRSDFATSVEEITPAYNEYWRKKNPELAKPKPGEPDSSAVSPAQLFSDPDFHFMLADVLASKGQIALSKNAVEEGLKLQKERNDANAPPKEGAGTQQERAFKVLKAAAIKQQSGQALTQEEQLDVEAATAMLERQSMMIDPVTNQPMFNQPITIPSSMKPRYGSVSAGGKAVNTVPSTSGGRKPIDPNTETKLSKMGEGVSQLISIDKMFKPEYVGFGTELVGKSALALDRRTGMGNAERADWHQRYEQWASDVRAEKFGLSLTGNELENFEKYKVRLSDTPEVAKKNIKRQMESVKNAIRRQRDAVKSSGQNSEQADALIGREAVRATEQSDGDLSPEEQEELMQLRKELGR